MNYWIFVTTDQDGLSAREIMQRRFQDGFWGLAENVDHMDHIQEGDRVIFYLGQPEGAFAGQAVLGSPRYELSDAQIEEKRMVDLELFDLNYAVDLENAEEWPEHDSVSVEGIASDLDLIENEAYWYVYFQGGIRQISESDYEKIIEANSLVSSGGTLDGSDAGADTQFALEQHLEEFMFENWDSIDWGRRLQPYETNDQNGRQFPAGTWSIDFLSQDVETGDLVVIELKRGKTSDKTVGQVLRYVNWVRQNLAQEGQNVEGIIVAGDVDESLDLAVSSLPDVEVLTYDVEFELHPFRE